MILSYGRITAEQCYIIKKTGSDCLCARLEQAGWSMADILALSREQLMEAVVELYLTSEVPAAMASFDAPTADLLSTKELELCEREIALRKMELRGRRDSSRKNKTIKACSTSPSDMCMPVRHLLSLVSSSHLHQPTLETRPTVSHVLK